MHMPQSLAKILIHTVFSTKDRRPFLREKPLRDELHHYLGGILQHLDCQPILVGGVEDHVHLLSTLARTCQPAELVKEVKRGSSIWIKSRDAALRDFSWQNGYGVFSYLKGYKFTAKSSKTFTASEGKQLQMKVVGYEKGNALTTDPKDRPDIKFAESIVQDKETVAKKQDKK